MNASVKASADLIPDLTRNVTEIKSTVAMTNEEKSKIEERTSKFEAFPLIPTNTITTPCGDVSVHTNTIVAGSSEKAFIFQRTDEHSPWPGTVTTELTQTGTSCCSDAIQVVFGCGCGYK